jgi:hypothetical protein
MRLRNGKTTDRDAPVNRPAMCRMADTPVNRFKTLSMGRIMVDLADRMCARLPACKKGILIEIIFSMLNNNLETREEMYYIMLLTQRLIPLLDVTNQSFFQTVEKLCREFIEKVPKLRRDPTWDDQLTLKLHEVLIMVTPRIVK